MSDPSVILLDEPAAGVNPRLLETILDRILGAQKAGQNNSSCRTQHGFSNGD